MLGQAQLRSPPRVLSAVYDGMSRTEAAKVMDRRAEIGRIVNEEREPLRRGPPPGFLRMGESVIVEEIDGVVPRRRIDLKRVIEERFGVI